ncbi:MAG: DNA polymerase III subunit chi [Alphaproteobacteria bacterium]
MSEILFYHLERSTLIDVLPTLLERSLERGWRAAISCPDNTELDALDTTLWTARDDSFLAHGLAGGKQDAEQPILLSTDEAITNSPQILFLTHGANAKAAENFTRIVDLFDGNDAQAVDAARSRFRAMRDAGHDVTYWRQSESGKWEKAG